MTNSVGYEWGLIFYYITIYLHIHGSNKWFVGKLNEGFTQAYILVKKQEMETIYFHLILDCNLKRCFLFNPNFCKSKKNISTNNFNTNIYL